MMPYLSLLTPHRNQVVNFLTSHLGTQVLIKISVADENSGQKSLGTLAGMIGGRKWVGGSLLVK